MFLPWLFSLFYKSIKISEFFLIVFFSCLFVGICLWVFSPEIKLYVGLSGILHTFFVYYSLKSFNQDKFISIFIFGVIFLRILQEQFLFIDKDISLVNDVAVDAHLYGFISGLLFFAIKKFLPFISKPKN
ncbi:MAG: Unknown protein [uncultured Campylobacterales bacterium]|uniref:Peptidase S54 rhomboid domain-containing protein n=1 Tax=uncultured Campylobacterales bacterium TaxID=352960 RepID=A0A6S6TE23_9BACT|nr:MAG: Unknown protein [uncultured Campylobacterales bacterium]